MTPWFLWLILTLATYRLWRLLALDTILERPRTAILVRAQDTRWERYADALWCPWCSGFWLCVAVFGITHALATPLTLWPLQAAAAATLVGLIGARDDG